MAGRVRITAVLGGGIGGLCAAAALCRAGFEVAVYEQAEELGEVGAGLTLWPNAVRVLRRLALADELIRRGSKIRRAPLRTSGGRILAESRPEDLELLTGEPTVAVHAPTCTTCSSPHYPGAPSTSARGSPPSRRRRAG